MQKVELGEGGGVKVETGLRKLGWAGVKTIDTMTMKKDEWKEGN